MIEIEKRIFVDEEIALNMEEYLNGERCDEIVNFIYYKPKKDEETQKPYWNFSHALNLARERMHDGRYKNYEILIKKLYV